MRTDIWREGKYVDLWSVPHFLSGVAVALGLHILDFSGIAAYSTAFLLLVGYEMFEVIAKIEETRMNRIFDVIVGMVAFVIAMLCIGGLSAQDVYGSFVLVTVLDMVISFFGWRESRKAAAFESKMKEEIVTQRLRIARGRKLIGKRLRKKRSDSMEKTVLGEKGN